MQHTQHNTINYVNSLNSEYSSFQNSLQISQKPNSQGGFCKKVFYRFYTSHQKLFIINDSSFTISCHPKYLYHQKLFKLLNISKYFQYNQKFKQLLKMIFYACNSTNIYTRFFMLVTTLLSGSTQYCKNIQKNKHYILLYHSLQVPITNKNMYLTLRCGLVCPLNLYAFTPKVWPLLNNPIRKMPVIQKRIYVQHSQIQIPVIWLSSFSYKYKKTCFVLDYKNTKIQKISRQDQIPEFNSFEYSAVDINKTQF
eukprot:TRINITY_DN12156_c0_g1_i2.p1 TRINITY_DN12156_c0_g1~~TRINITY_DN12156_c0_g1_i2.p1  ORF type:complete len:253 (+),score=-23.05 TRINITY_DN12156_c0_g1_i2:263-1021(+)